MKRTLILGATENPTRYAYLAANRLVGAGHEIVPVGIKAGEVAGVPINTSRDIPTAPIDTITLYVGPDKQPAWYDYILAVKPKRLIFNPGAENDELAQLATANGITPVYECTLVLLSTEQY
jgi:uncharacterized protein